MVISPSDKSSSKIACLKWWGLLLEFWHLGLALGKVAWCGWMTKIWEPDPLYMWERVGMQGFLDDLQEEVSISGWLLAYILDAVISEEVSVAVNCFRIWSELPD